MNLIDKLAALTPETPRSELEALIIEVADEMGIKVVRKPEPTEAELTEAELLDRELDALEE